MTKTTGSFIMLHFHVGACSFLCDHVGSYPIDRRPGQQGLRVKYVTGAPSKSHGRDNITVDKWNTRTLRAAGKLQELTHEMDGYRWNPWTL